MNLRPLLLATLAAAALALPATASAHDPEEHALMEAQRAPAKAIPTTCAELDDTARFSNDTARPEIKALAARCAAEKKAAKPATAKKK